AHRHLHSFPTRRSSDLEDVVLTIATIDERELPGLARLPTRRVEDEAGGAVPVVTHLPACHFVLLDVFVSEEAVVWHSARVSRARSEEHTSELQSQSNLV